MTPPATRRLVRGLAAAFFGALLATAPAPAQEEPEAAETGVAEDAEPAPDPEPTEAGPDGAEAEGDEPEADAEPELPVEPTRVSYYRQAIAEKDGRRMKLFGNSWWELERPKVAAPADYVVILLSPEEPNLGVAFLLGDEIPIRHVRGFYSAERGYLSTLSQSIDTGTQLELEDGSLWNVPKYNQAHTGSWLPPDPILVTWNQQYLINLRSGEKIWARRVDLREDHDTEDAPDEDAPAEGEPAETAETAESATLAGDAAPE